MLVPDFNPFPVLETPRLILRRPLLPDAADIFEMRSDPEVMRYIPRPLAKTHDEVHALLHILDEYVDKNERINWAIEWKETGKVIGLIGYVDIQPEHFRAEVGYSLARAWHRKGVMREALATVIDYGFSALRLHSVSAVLDADNTPSARLLEDAGFIKEAYFREDFFHDGVFRNSLHYGLLETDWRK